MPIIPLTCPNCGGNLTVDSSLEAAVCSHCKKPYIVKDAVFQNYITNITNITADTVNVYSEKDFEIKGGKLVKYNGESDHVVIPSTAKIIGNGAFAGMPIADVVIPNTVLEIHSDAFKGCKFLKKASVPGGAKLGSGGIAGSMFANCASLETIELGSGITEIPYAMFRDCRALKTITLPESVTIIGEDAFSGCTALQEITIPKNVVEIMEGAFEGCIALHRVTISEGVTAIGPNMFKGCTALKEVTIPQSVNSIGFRAFSGCTALKTVNYLGATPGLYNYEAEEYPHINKLHWVFDGTPYLALKEQQSEQWKKEKRCRHCGGSFEGVFSKTCSCCGKPKDY